MNIQWSESALLDLQRVHAFLANKNPAAATQITSLLIQSAKDLAHFPRRGKVLEHLAAHEIRRLIVVDYEMRYTIVRDTITIVYVWHVREDR